MLIFNHTYTNKNKPVSMYIRAHTQTNTYTHAHTHTHTHTHAQTNKHTNCIRLGAFWLLHHRLHLFEICLAIRPLERCGLCREVERAIVKGHGGR